MGDVNKGRPHPSPLAPWPMVAEEPATSLKACSALLTPILSGLVQARTPRNETPGRETPRPISCRGP